MPLLPLLLLLALCACDRPAEPATEAPAPDPAKTAEPAPSPADDAKKPEPGADLPKDRALYSKVIGELCKEPDESYARACGPAKKVLVYGDMASAGATSQRLTDAQNQCNSGDCTRLALEVMLGAPPIADPDPVGAKSLLNAPCNSSGPRQAIACALLALDEALIARLKAEPKP